MLFRHHVNNVGEVSVRRSRNGLRDLLAQQSCITVSTRMEPTGQCDEKVSLSGSLVFIGGSMGTSSAISWSGLVLRPEHAFASSCHGAADD